MQTPAIPAAQGVSNNLRLASWCCAVCLLRRFRLAVCCHCCAASLLSARTFSTSTTAFGELGSEERGKGRGCTPTHTHTHARPQFHDTHMVQPLSLLQQGVAALNVWAVSQACCCLCYICYRHKKKPEWWASLEPSLHALGKDYQVRCD